MKQLTYRGILDMGVQKKVHLSTNNGLTGYRIKEFQLMSTTPGSAGNVTYIGKIYATTQTGSIDANVNMSDTGLLAVNYYQDQDSPAYPFSQQIIIEAETINQDIYVYIVNPDGGTIPCNYYLVLEQYSIDLNTSTVSTLKNLRQSKADIA